MPYDRLSLYNLGFILIIAFCSIADAKAACPPVTHVPMTGDVQATSVMIWRHNQPSKVQFSILSK